PLRDATRWIVDAAPADATLVVDDAIWVDLVEAGVDPDRLTSYAALVADTGRGADRPRPAPEHDLVVVTGAYRSFRAGHPQLAVAVGNSTPVVAFGSGDERVEIRRVG